jgi:hypothetical protein
LQPLEDKSERDTLDHLPIDLIFNLLLRNVPFVVISLSGPLLLVVVKDICQMCKRGSLISCALPSRSQLIQLLELFSRILKEIIEDRCVKRLELLALPRLLENNRRRKNDSLENLLVRDCLQDVRIQKTTRQVEIDLVVVPWPYHDYQEV